MIAEIKKLALKWMESVYRNNSYKYKLLGDLLESSFISKEPNTIFDTQVACYRQKMSTETLITDKFLVVLASFRFELRKENPMRTFRRIPPVRVSMQEPLSNFFVAEG